MTAVWSPDFSIAIGRDLGTVVVSVHGEVDAPAATHLGAILTDLIDGQGNLCLVVDLAYATATDSDLSVFAVAAERARLRGGLLILRNPGGPLHQSLRRSGLNDLIVLAVDGGSRPFEPAMSTLSRREWTVHPAGHVRRAGPTPAPLVP